VSDANVVKVGVRQPRVRDRGAADDARHIRFTPAILPPYARRSRSLEVLIPILYPKGISTGDFEETIAALLGKDAPGLSDSTIARLKEVWIDEHEHWSKRDLSAKRYVYVWADGIYLQARLADAKQCILVIIGATPEGKKELLGFTDGARETAQDWRELLLDLQNRGLTVAPELAVVHGVLGFWKALAELWPTTREQRCWVHKTANVLNKLPKSHQPKAKRSLQEIWMAETSKDAGAAFDAFIAAYELKCDKVAQCLAKDRQALLAFYDLLAQARWPQPVAQARSRCQLHQWDRNRSIRHPLAPKPPPPEPFAVTKIRRSLEKSHAAAWPRNRNGVRAHCCSTCREDSEGGSA
jgi:transposase-like protein